MNSAPEQEDVCVGAVAENVSDLGTDIDEDVVGTVPAPLDPVGELLLRGKVIDGSETIAPAGDTEVETTAKVRSGAMTARLFWLAATRTSQPR